MKKIILTIFLLSFSLLSYAESDKDYERSFIRDLNSIVALALKENGTSGYYLHKGILYENLGDFEDAFYNYTKSIALDKGNIYALEQRALLSYSLKKIKISEHDAKKILVKNPSSFVGNFIMASIATDKNKYEEALVSINKAISANDESTLSYILRSRIYMNMDKTKNKNSEYFKKSLEDIRKVRELDPNNSIVKDLESKGVL